MKNILQKIGAAIKAFIKSPYFKPTLIVVALTLPMIALAETPASPGSSEDVNKIFQGVINILIVATEFIQRLIWPILLLIGSLLKNDILFGGGMEDRILAVWYVIRNFVNILMVLVLLGIALYNTAGGKAQDYHLKAILPKFVIALIAVNFSFAMVKIAVDGVNVLTTAIFALPVSVENGFGQGIDNIFASEADYQETICKGLYGQEVSKYKAGVTEAKNSGGFTFCNESAFTLTDSAKLYFAKFDGYNAGIVLAVNMMKLGGLNKVNVLEASLKDLFVNIIFSTFLYIIYGAAFIALFCVLLVRLVVVWMALILSPLMVLPSVLPEKIKSAMGGDSKDKIVQTIIAPIPIAVVMTLGFILLTGLQKSSFPGLAAPGASAKGSQLLLSGYSTLQELIVAIGTVAFLWIGIFKATNGTFAEKLVNGVKSTVEGVGKFAMSSLKYAPIFPVQVGQPGSDGKSAPTMMSIGALTSAARKLPTAMERKGEEQGDVFMKNIESQRFQQARELALNAKDSNQLKQSLGAGGTSMLGDKESIRRFGEKLNANPNWEKDFKWNVDIHSKKDPKKVLSRKDFIKGMMNGGEDINEADFEKWRRENEQKAPDLKAKKDDKPGVESKGFDAARAGTIMGMSGAYMGTLNPKEKKAVDSYNAAKDQKAKDKILQGDDFQSAMSTLNSAGNDDLSFKLPKLHDAKELDDAIAKRRKSLIDTYTKAGKKDVEAAAEADKVIAAELSKPDISADSQKLIDSSGQAKKYQAQGKAPAPVAAKPGPPAKGGPVPVAPQPPAGPVNKGSGPPTADPPKAPVGPVPITISKTEAAGRGITTGGVQKIDGVEYNVTIQE